MWSDTVYWVQNTDFDQAVALEGNYGAYDAYTTVDKFGEYVSVLTDAGVSYIAPPSKSKINIVIGVLIYS